MPHPAPPRTAPAADSFLGGLRASFVTQACVWVALVALGVAGRLWQPAWHVTPMAAVAVAAGVVFPHALVAASVPVAALVVSNLGLESYESLPMAAVVLAATAWPVVLGGLVRRAAAAGRVPGVLAVLGGALASSLVFFFATNLAFWWFTAEYPHTAAGLAECFAAALPFYRWMPAGDVAWTAVTFAGLAAAARTLDAAAARRLAPAVATAESRPVKRASDVA